MHFDKEVDTKGLSCPLPIMHAKKAMAALASGQTVKILATDPASKRDFIAFTSTSGNELLFSDEVSGIFTFFIKKK